MVAPTTIFAVDLKDRTLARLLAVAKQGAELALKIVGRADLLARLAAPDEAGIVVLEWEANAEQLCADLRRASAPERCYIVAVANETEREQLQRARGVANDVMVLPLAHDHLLERLRWGARVMEALRSIRGPRQALEEALESEDGGEVVARSGDVVARIHVRDGSIVWAHVSSAPATLEELVRDAGAPADPDLITALKEECRTTGANFMDVLVRWGMVNEERARATLHAFVTDRVRMVLELPNASALFMPRVRSTGPASVRSSQLSTLSGPASFRAPQTDPLLDAVGPESNRRPSRRPTFMNDLLNEAIATTGATGAALLDRRTGDCLGQVGEDQDPDFMRLQVQMLNALGQDAEEVLASNKEHHFITRSLSSPHYALFVTLSTSGITLGLARLSIAQLEACTSAQERASQ